jgi:hypothetical protein
VGQKVVTFTLLLIYKTTSTGLDHYITYHLHSYTPTHARGDEQHRGETLPGACIATCKR